MSNTSKAIATDAKIGGNVIAPSTTSTEENYTIIPSYDLDSPFSLTKEETQTIVNILKRRETPSLPDFCDDLLQMVGTPIEGFLTNQPFAIALLGQATETPQVAEFIHATSHVNKLLFNIVNHFEDLMDICALLGAIQVAKTVYDVQ